MSEFLGPLDTQGRIPARQQTRVSAFLISAHGALSRQFAFTLPVQFKSAWQTELNAQLYRESEIVSLLLRATNWAPDFALAGTAFLWETAWIPKPLEGISDPSLALTTDLAILAHAVHAIRPAALLPVDANPDDPFVTALRRIEFESSRLLQAQIVFLKGADLMPFRDIVNSAVEKRHAEVRNLWTETLASIGITNSRPV